MGKDKASKKSEGSKKSKKSVAAEVVVKAVVVKADKASGKKKDKAAKSDKKASKKAKKAPSPPPPSSSSEDESSEDESEEEVRDLSRGGHTRKLEEDLMSLAACPLCEGQLRGGVWAVASTAAGMRVAQMNQTSRPCRGVGTRLFGRTTANYLSGLRPPSHPLKGQGLLCATQLMFPPRLPLRTQTNSLKACLRNRADGSILDPSCPFRLLSLTRSYAGGSSLYPAAIKVSILGQDRMAPV